MELHKGLGNDELWVEYPKAYKKVEERYKVNLKRYYKNY